jgi:hypothetical protein
MGPLAELRKITPIISRACYQAGTGEFLLVSPAAVLGELVAHHTFAVDENQRRAWQGEIEHLQQVATDLPNSFFFLEFAIPRMGKRADAVIITRGLVFVLEYKVGGLACAGTRIFVARAINGATTAFAARAGST